MIFDDDDEIIPGLTFSGTEESWFYWSEKFLALARQQELADVLLGNESVPTDTEFKELTVGTDDALIRAYERNQKAYDALILLIETDKAAGRVAFGIVRRCKTDNLKNGDAKLAWERLKSRFASKSPCNFLRLKNKYSNSRLRSINADPDVWIDELERLRMQLWDIFEHEITDFDFMIHLLINVPREYKNTKARLERKLQDPNEPLTIDEIRDAYSLTYSRRQH